MRGSCSSINKSNQFNLTTRRYTEADVAAVQNDPDAFTLQVRLSDAFGDNGMISVLICRRQQDDWNIDTWLMSCRVLGRKVETPCLQELVTQARARGIERLVGSYLPTAKNKLVEDHYAKLGFTLLDKRDDGGTAWELHVDGAPLVALPIAIRRVGCMQDAQGWGKLAPAIGGFPRNDPKAPIATAPCSR